MSNVCVYATSLFLHSQSHTHTHSLSLVRVVMMKSKELKTKIYSHAHSLILTLCGNNVCKCVSHSVGAPVVINKQSRGSRERTTTASSVKKKNWHAKWYSTDVWLDDGCLVCLAVCAASVDLLSWCLWHSVLSPTISIFYVPLIPSLCLSLTHFLSLSLSVRHYHLYLLLWWNLRNSRPRFLMIILWFSLRHRKQMFLE